MVEWGKYGQKGRSTLGTQQKNHAAHHAAHRLCGTAVLGTLQHLGSNKGAGKPAGSAVAAAAGHLHRLCAEPDDGGAGAAVGPCAGQMGQPVEPEAEAARLPDADHSAVHRHHLRHLLHPYSPAGGGGLCTGGQHPHLRGPDPGMVGEPQRLRSGARRDPAGAVAGRGQREEYHHRLFAGEGRQRGEPPPSWGRW